MVIAPLQDSHQRKFEYLRLSVTDVCNFKCVYCLPQGYEKNFFSEKPLSVFEIQNLVRGFAALGFWKVRLTGGEPTTRQDIVEIAAAVAEIPGIEQVALSTNGYRLKALAPQLKQAGVTALNVSIDSLNEEKFQAITGRQGVQEILEGVDDALRLGFKSLKVNAVLLQGFNEGELDQFIAWVQTRPLSVRFIELMQTGRNAELFKAHHLSGGYVKLKLLSEGWRQRPRRRGDGPAVEYEHPQYQGRMGIIAPYSQDFCVTCNRLRVSSRGALKLCLFGNGEFSLRHLLQSETQTLELVDQIRILVEGKPESHYLHEGKYGNTWNLAAIGG